MAKMAAKWLKSIPNLWPKRLKNHTLWDRTYLYSPYKGVPLPAPEQSGPIYNKFTRHERSNRKAALGQRSFSKKHVSSMNSILETAIWSFNTGQRILCLDRWQLTIWGMSSQRRTLPRLFISFNLLAGVWSSSCATPWNQFMASFAFLYGMGLPLASFFSLFGRKSSAINLKI